MEIKTVVLYLFKSFYHRNSKPVDFLVLCFLDISFHGASIAISKNMFSFIAIFRFHIIYWSHFTYSSENKMSGPRVHTSIFFVYFRTERMMWKKIDTLFSLGQWTEIKMKLSIFPSAAHFYLACDCGSIFPVFYFLSVLFLFFYFLSSIVRNSFSI